jgi:NADP-dependent 3-hydroxy acid dehydrogenase YdfG
MVAVVALTAAALPGMLDGGRGRVVNVSSGIVTRGRGDTMTGWRALEEFLRADPRDVGCERAIEVLDIYVDVVSADGVAAAGRRFSLGGKNAAAGDAYFAPG